METKYLWWCPECHSTNVQIKAWVKQNCGYRCPDDCGAGEEEGWCCDCEEHHELEFAELQSIGEAFVPMNSIVWVHNEEDPINSGMANFYRRGHKSIEDGKCLAEIFGTDKLQLHKNENIYFLPEQLITYGWECTDPDNHQYCQALSEYSYRYKEFNWFEFDKEYQEEYGITPKQVFNEGKYWIEFDIDLNDTSESEINSAISGYYDSLDELKEQYGEDWKQIVCECIFEYTNGLY